MEGCGASKPWWLALAMAGALACTESVPQTGEPAGAVVPDQVAQGGSESPTPSATGTDPSNVVTDDATAGAGGDPMPAQDTTDLGNGAPPATDEPAGTPPTGPASPPSAGTHPPWIKRILWLDILGNGVYSARPDGSETMRVADALAAPDGIVSDDCSGVVYFSNMGNPLGGSGLASVQRFDGDGAPETLIAPGSGINTAKQLTLDTLRNQLYIADREGASIWRSDANGQGLELLARGHGFAQLVGIAVDGGRRVVYFTDRNNGQVLRMGADLPAGETPDDRSDVEILYQGPAGAMPIDLALDAEAQELYLTDRSLGTVQRMGTALPAGETPEARSDVEVLFDGLVDPIGIALLRHDDILYFTELGGAVHRARLDGSEHEVVAHSGSATGITLSGLASFTDTLFCD